MHQDNVDEWLEAVKLRREPLPSWLSVLWLPGILVSLCLFASWSQFIFLPVLFIFPPFLLWRLFLLLRTAVLAGRMAQAWAGFFGGMRNATLERPGACVE